MKSVVVLSLVLLAGLFQAADAMAGKVVEGIVKDASGQVLLDENIYESDIPKLVQYLKGGGVEAEQSVGLLVQFGSAAVPELVKELPGLMKTVEDNVGSGAGNVISVLSGIPDERLVRPLSSYMAGSGEFVSMSVIGVLTSYGDISLPVMMELKGGPNTRDAALAVLKGISPSEGQLKGVRPDLDSKDAAKRMDAALLLGTWHDDQSDGVIKKAMLSDPDVKVRRAAAKGYFEMNWLDPEGFDTGTLISALKDSDPEVRAGAVDMLDRVQDDRVEPALVAHLGTEKDHKVLKMAIDALVNKKSDAAVFPVMKLMDRDDPDQNYLQVTVVWALGELGAKEALPYMIETLQSDNRLPEIVLIEYLDALTKIGEPVEVDPLLKYLDPKRVGDGCCGDDQTDVILRVIEQFAKPGDTVAKAAVEKFKPHARENQQDIIQRILDRL